MSTPARHARAILVAAMVLATALPAVATTLSRTSTATATVNSRAKLSISSNTLAFPNADPDTTPAIAASGGALSITAKASTTIGSTVQLVVLASGDLLSGVDQIGISALKWTVSGTGFAAGTMSKTVAQSVASWVSSGSWTGTQSYTLDNAWTYATGAYSTTLTYTLTAP